MSMPLTDQEHVFAADDFKVGAIREGWSMAARTDLSAALVLSQACRWKLKGDKGDARLASSVCNLLARKAETSLRLRAFRCQCLKKDKNVARSDWEICETIKASMENIGELQRRLRTAWRKRFKAEASVHAGQCVLERVAEWMDSGKHKELKDFSSQLRDLGPVDDMEVREARLAIQQLVESMRSALDDITSQPELTNLLSKVASGELSTDALRNSQASESDDLASDAESFGLVCDLMVLSNHFETTVRMPQGPHAIFMELEQRAMLVRKALDTLRLGTTACVGITHGDRPIATTALCAWSDLWAEERRAKVIDCPMPSTLQRLDAFLKQLRKVSLEPLLHNFGTEHFGLATGRDMDAGERSIMLAKAQELRHVLPPTFSALVDKAAAHVRCQDFMRKVDAGKHVGILECGQIKATAVPLLEDAGNDKVAALVDRTKTHWVAQFDQWLASVSVGDFEEVFSFVSTGAESVTSGDVKDAAWVKYSKDAAATDKLRRL